MHVIQRLDFALHFIVANGKMKTRSVRWVTVSLRLKKKKEVSNSEKAKVLMKL